MTGKGPVFPVGIVPPLATRPSSVTLPRSSSAAAASATATPSPGPSTPAGTDDLARRVAEARRRVADAHSRVSVKDNPYLVSHLILYSVLLPHSVKFTGCGTSC